jgi:hypothetical protein
MRNYITKAFFLRHQHICVTSPFVIMFLKEVFEGIVLPKSLLPFPRNPYFKANVTSLLNLFFIKNFKENDVEFLTESFLKTSFKKMITSPYYI